MSTVIIAIGIVMFVMLIFSFLVYVHGRQRIKVAKELIAQFQHEEKENNLLISKWEMAGNLVIELAADKKKLLAFHKHLGRPASFLVDLSKVRSCLKKKIYSSKNNTYAKNGRQVEYVSLELEFMDERPPVMITFYHPVDNRLSEMAEMEQKAADWERLINDSVNSII